MPLPIADYALIGDMRCSALVGRNGSIDWFCPPRFDAEACFAALLGDQRNGFWRIAPTAETSNSCRYYDDDSLNLCTEFSTDGGKVRLTDCMPLECGVSIIRTLECLEGEIEMAIDLAPRFGYGKQAPEFSDLGDHFRAENGEHSLVLLGAEGACIEAQSIRLNCRLTAGERRHFILTYEEAETRRPSLEEADLLIRQTHDWWNDWASRCSYKGRWRDAVVRSLVTLKALTYAPAGGMVSAPTTSLPEAVGGGANWDYRFCWIRDAVWALDIFVDSGYMDEACVWRDWLLEVIERDQGQIKVLYTIDGKSPMEEVELDWLQGYLDSRPVRIGNAASDQHQLDVYGQLMDFLHLCRRNGMQLHDVTWGRQRDLMNALIDCWKEPDEGIWELRGERMHYTHSKVYAWAAFDRSIRDAEEFGLDAPLERWRQARDEIFEDVCRRGFDSELGVFTQTYEQAKPDASLLMIPLLGFLPAEDRRVQATVEWIREELCKEGLMHRLRGEDTFAGEEGAFLTCSFWMVDVLTMTGKKEEAQNLFEKVLALRNDVGLLAEEYDPGRGMLGNFPQALSHLALIKSAYLLQACDDAHRGDGPERHSYHPIP